MPPNQKLLYVVADGGTARLIERRPDGAFVTVRKLDGRAQLALARDRQRNEQAGRSIESATTMRHAVGRNDDYRRAKAVFAHETAAAVRGMLSDKPWTGVVLAAPSRLLRVFQEELEGQAGSVQTLAKDLTKTPDHELSRWLDHIEFGAV